MSIRKRESRKGCLSRTIEFVLVLSIRKTEWRGVLSGAPFCHQKRKGAGGSLKGNSFRLGDQTAPRGKALAPIPPDGELNESVKRGERRLPAPVFRTEYNRIYKGRRRTGRFWLFFRTDGCWLCPDGREGEVVLGRAAYMTGEGRSGGGVYAREKGDLGESSICPGKGRSGGGAYVRERGRSRRRQYMSGRGEFRRRQSFVKRF